MPFPKDRAGLEREVKEQKATVKASRGDSEAMVRERGKALWEIGECLYRLGNYKQSVKYLEEAEFALSDVVSLRWLTVQSRVTRATSLLVLGRIPEALEAVEQALATARAGTDMPVPDMIPMALWLRINILTEFDRKQEAHTSAKSLIVQLEPGDTPAQRKILVDAKQLVAQIGSGPAGPPPDALRATR